MEKINVDELLDEECNGLDQVQVLTDQCLQILPVARENIQRVQEKQRELYDRKHASPSTFLKGVLKSFGLFFKLFLQVIW